MVTWERGWLGRLKKTWLRCFPSSLSGSLALEAVSKSPTSYLYRIPKPNCLRFNRTNMFSYGIFTTKIGQPSFLSSWKPRVRLSKVSLQPPFAAPKAHFMARQMRYDLAKFRQNSSKLWSVGVVPTWVQVYGLLPICQGPKTPQKQMLFTFWGQLLFFSRNIFHTKKASLGAVVVLFFEKQKNGLRCGHCGSFCHQILLWSCRLYWGLGLRPRSCQGRPASWGRKSLRKSPIKVVRVGFCFRENYGKRSKNDVLICFDMFYWKKRYLDSTSAGRQRVFSVGIRRLVHLTYIDC